MTSRASSIFSSLHRAQPFGFSSRRFVRDRVLNELGKFNDHMLRDIGLTRSDLEVFRRQK